MANIVFDDIEGDDNIIPLFADSWTHTQGPIYSRMPFYAALGFRCYVENRLIHSYSDGSFETTDYANELINNSILSFIFVFDDMTTYVNFSDVRGVTTMYGGLTLSYPNNVNDTFDIAGTVVNRDANSMFSPKFTIKRGIIINREFTGVGIVLNGQNLSTGSYVTSITGGDVGALNGTDYAHAYLIPKYL